MRAHVFRFAPKSGHCATDSTCPVRANSGSLLSPSVARHALAGVRARDDGELAFESRSEQDAAERRPIWSNRWEADFRRWPSHLFDGDDQFAEAAQGVVQCALFHLDMNYAAFRDFGGG
jgi:hypothetical protein